jgi:DNA-binding protein HU-beta
MEETGMLKEDATKIVDCVFGHVRKKLLEGREVRIDGVGHFAIKFKDATTVHNNLTGGRHKVGPRVRMKFKTFPSMQRDLNENLLEEHDG